MWAVSLRSSIIAHIFAPLSGALCFTEVLVIIRVLILVSLSFSAFANDSCERTKEYVELRDEIFKLVNKPYKECKSTTNRATHWKAVASCMADGQGADAFECGSLVENQEYPLDYANLEHCELLKPSLEFFKQTLHEIADAKEIIECKT